MKPPLPSPAGGDRAAPGNGDGADAAARARADALITIICDEVLRVGRGIDGGDVNSKAMTAYLDRHRDRFVDRMPPFIAAATASGDDPAALAAAVARIGVGLYRKDCADRRDRPGAMPTLPEIDRWFHVGTRKRTYYLKEARKDIARRAAEHARIAAVERDRGIADLVAAPPVLRCEQARDGHPSPACADGCWSGRCFPAPAMTAVHRRLDDDLPDDGDGDDA